MNGTRPAQDADRRAHRLPLQHPCPISVFVAAGLNECLSIHELWEWTTLRGNITAGVIVVLAPESRSEPRFNIPRYQLSWFWPLEASFPSTRPAAGYPQ